MYQQHWSELLWRPFRSWAPPWKLRIGNVRLQIFGLAWAWRCWTSTCPSGKEKQTVVKLSLCCVRAPLYKIIHHKDDPPACPAENDLPSLYLSRECRVTIVVWCTCNGALEQRSMVPPTGACLCSPPARPDPTLHRGRSDGIIYSMDIGEQRQIMLSYTRTLLCWTCS